jgi:rSAM/selenodomain-associated transferase 1
MQRRRRRAKELLARRGRVAGPLGSLPQPRRQHQSLRVARSSAVPFRPRLVIFARAPVGGRVKTRLGRELGVGVATRFARQCAAALLARVANDRRWQTIIAETGDACGGRFWPPAIARCAQGGGDLGQRMQRIMQRMPPGPTVIVGTDIPVIRPAHIAQAMRALGRHDAVFGPATDGGYWLVGLRRRPRVFRLFAGVRWSSAHALADTLENLNGRSVFYLAKLQDVDTAADFATAGAFARRVLPALTTAQSGRGSCRAQAQKSEAMPFFSQSP